MSRVEVGWKRSDKDRRRSLSLKGSDRRIKEIVRVGAKRSSHESTRTAVRSENSAAITASGKLQIFRFFTSLNFAMRHSLSLNVTETINVKVGVSLQSSA